MIGLGCIKSFYGNSVKAAATLKQVNTKELQYIPTMIMDTVTLSGRTKSLAGRMSKAVTPVISNASKNAAGNTAVNSAAKAAANVTAKAAANVTEKANVLYQDVDMTQDGFELIVDGVNYALKGPQRKKLRKLAVGETAHIGGGSSAENELFNICGLKVNHLTITKNGDNSFKVINNFASNAPKAERSAIEILEGIKNRHPEFYNILKKELDTGNLKENSLELIIDSIQKPVTDITYTNAIKHYKNDGFKIINKLMRKEDVQNLSDAYKVQIKKETKALTECIASRPFNKELQLYRGDRYSILDNVVLTGGKYKGQKLSDVLQNAEKLSRSEKELLLLDITSNNDIMLTQPSFLSTSILKSGSKQDKPLQLNLTTKGEIQGLCLDTNVNTRWENEMEYLVQQNSKMHFTNIAPSDDGKWIIDATLSL